MEEFSATMIDEIGFHARPAALVAKVAGKFKETAITIYYGEKKGNLKSIMNVMALGIKTKTDFKVVAEGPDAKQAIKEIIAVMKEGKLITLHKA